MSTPVGPYWPRSLDLVDYEDRLVEDKALTADGMQWSTEVQEDTAGTEKVAFSKTIDPDVRLSS